AQILHDEPATTALVTLNEAALGGVYRGLAEAGRLVPRDFSITGIAAGRWAETMTPQLTAADVPASELGRLAVDLLVERLEHPAAAQLRCRDRKSTRLNSSHVKISYAVFCSKKKKSGTVRT